MGDTYTPLAPITAPLATMPTMPAGLSPNEKLRYITCNGHKPVRY